MEKEQRNRLQKATQDARKLLEEEFRSQLLQTYDIDVEKVRWAEEPGAHLQAEQRLIREKLMAWIEHKEAQINDRKEALLLALREMAFTALNRFVALKLMEARKLVRPCVSGGLESAGFLEFTAVAQGLLADQESSYRLYLETIFEDVSRELRALFDPRDPASLLWPKRAALLELLDILNRPELAELWIEDETLGWVYQYFNGDAERKKMREESAAPRNSRELAVRNQFFTPRYVVEFLTDNTLGRIWYEMRQGNTGLKDQCRYLVRRPNEVWLQPGEVPPAQPDTDETPSQEELLRQPVYIPHRPLKDPREIRMLDPACGSMHFGLYSFDLYLEIYAEAWEIAHGSDGQAKQGELFAPFVAYAAGFADKLAFLGEVPRLILQHNIHGIDIDPRATQIAQLTLWLRAQRAWQEQQLEVATRPPITRSNVVCAEPMPGERELLADFVDQQFPDAEKGLVQQFLESIFDKMQLAGEAGSLLKIEEEIRDAIDQARWEWQRLANRQQDLFGLTEFAALGQAGSSMMIDLQHLTKDFWLDIEDRIYIALQEYAKQAEASSGFQRRLFAEDAAQGFAFIDVCRKRYDVALMNPPFGLALRKNFEKLQKGYPDAYVDVFAAFIARLCGICTGRIGAITSRSLLVTKKLERLRSKILLPQISELLDLGWPVMDGATVQSCAYVLGQDKPGVHTDFFAIDRKRLEAKDSDLSAACKLQEGSTDTYFVERSRMTKIPRSKILYNLPAKVTDLFAGEQSLGEELLLAKQGMKSFDDVRFLRLRSEVDPEMIGPERHWEPLSKGGPLAFFYSDLPLLIHWRGTGDEIAEVNRQLNGQTAQARQASIYYRRPGGTYSRRCKDFGVRALPRGFIIGEKGPAVLPKGNVPIAFLIGLLNTRLANALVNLQANAKQYDTGIIEGLPSVPLEADVIGRIDELSISAIQAQRVLSGLIEGDSLFCRSVRGSSFDEIREQLLSLAKTKTQCVNDSLAEINSIIDSVFGVSTERLSDLVGEIGNDESPEVEQLDEEADEEAACNPNFVSNKNELLENEVSYLLGCAFGRWDIRYATGEQSAVETPDAFAPLPICPPGQLQNERGLPARPEDVPASYPVCIPWDGILVDDPNHPLDLELRIREVIKIVWGSKEGSPTAEAIESEACEILGVDSLRDYFRKPAGFFANHLKRYSKSRRQAPIYWQLSCGSGSYSAWLYYHRFTQDTLYRVLRDFVEPRIQQAERDQFELESQGALSGDAANGLQEAHTLLQDLRIFKSELDLVAPLWNPNFNDGVIINHAILWRITPYTPWQKKCKECWDKLVKGDYDWAHLAFHLWPERVIPKCVTDRSLAIAHGLNERLWQETNNGNWLPGQLPDADLQALIAEHSNPAVKSALERFLAAPPPVAPTRTRASRSTRATGTSTPRRARGSTAVVDAEATRQVLLALTAAPPDGLAKTQIADLIGVEANALTAVIKQLKESAQIDQLGERRGARYLLSEQGRAAVAADAEGDE